MEVLVMLRGVDGGVGGDVEGLLGVVLGCWGQCLLGVPSQMYL